MANEPFPSAWERWCHSRLALSLHHTPRTIPVVMERSTGALALADATASTIHAVLVNLKLTFDSSVPEPCPDLAVFELTV